MTLRLTPGGWLAGALLLGVALCAAEKKVDLSKLPPPATKTGLTYDKDLKPFLEKSCLKCHSGDKPKAKYEISTREGMIRGGDSEEPAVVPGQSAKSPLIHYVSGAVKDMEMPPLDKRDKFPELTREQIGLLRAWIDQGAK